MKKLIKFLIIAFFILVGLGIAASLGGNEPEAQPVKEATAEKEAPQEAPVEEPAKEEATLPGKAEYDAVKNGMTREQVEQLFDKVDVQLESESEFENIKTLMVIYGAEGDFGASITVTYIDGVVESKSNFEIK